MSGEHERDESVSGKVITGGIAQSVTREGGVVRVKLTRMPGQPLPQTTYGAMTSIPFPEPVKVEAGETLAVDMEWLPEPAREQAGQPMHMGHPATLTNAITGPSAARPGQLQAAVSDGEPSLLPDAYGAGGHY